MQEVQSPEYSKQSQSRCRECWERTQPLLWRCSGERGTGGGRKGGGAGYGVVSEDSIVLGDWWRRPGK